MGEYVQKGKETASDYYDDSVEQLEKQLAAMKEKAKRGMSSHDKTQRQENVPIREL